MASYGVLEEHTTLDPDFSILAFAFCWACGLSWNEAWANVKSSLLDIPMSKVAGVATYGRKAPKKHKENKGKTGIRRSMLHGGREKMILLPYLLSY
jgi:hypothetical protein